MDDWRLVGQEDYMKNINIKKVGIKELQLKAANWHEHCEFCMSKITNKSSTEYYTTEDEYRWICPKCYADFKESFNWKLKE